MSPHGSRPGAGRQGVLVAAMALGLVAACTGEISSIGGNADGIASGGKGSGAGGGSATGGAVGVAGVAGVAGGPAKVPQVFACDANVVPDALPLRRLSRRQLVNTVSDLVKATATSDAGAILTEVGSLLDAMPGDSPAGLDKHYGNFSNLDQDIQQEHTDGLYALATGLGQKMTSTPERLAKVVGACATGASDDACLTSFIRSFGARALRRPLTDEDVAFYKEPAVKAPYTADDYADVIGSLLAAPEAFFLVEHGDESVTTGAAPLTAHELASRLSYHFWQTSPDEALLAHAKAGDLTSEAVFASEVERLFKDARTRAALGTFFDEWLKNTTLEQLSARIGDKVYDQQRGGYTPTPETRDRLFAEVTDAALYYAFDKPASFDTFFKSTRSFARTDDVAQLYGVPVWDGKSEPAEVPGRAGLLTRPALVATGTTGTRPIMKGVFIRKNLLCDVIGDPPAAAMNVTVPVVSQSSTRDRIEALTGKGTCGEGCHATMINDLGFVTQNFDSFGRPRASEALFNADGAASGTAAIDTSATPRVSLSDGTKVSGAAELTSLIADSPKLDACFARQYFRYTFGRIEDLKTAKDSCALSNLETALRQDADLGSVLRAVALHPSFKTRSFQ